MSGPDGLPANAGEPPQGGVEPPREGVGSHGPTPARGHIDRPAVLVNIISTHLDVPRSRNATNALTDFLDRGLPQLYRNVSEWGVDEAISFVNTTVFPREAVPMLAEICRLHGVVLVRGQGLIAYNRVTREYAAFDYRLAVESMIDTIPDAGDVYTFGVRKNVQRPPIVCSLDIA
jgi:hypothetical protein